MALRVLHVLDKLAINSGTTNVIMNYFKKIDCNQIAFDFMLNQKIADEDLIKLLEDRGSKVFVMPELKISNVFKYIKALRDFYDNHEYKIIHGHVANSAVFYLGLARNVPIKILHSQNSGGVRNKLKKVRNFILTRLVKAVPTHFLACSNEAAMYLFGKQNTAKLIGNAIDIESFSFNPSAREKVRNKLNANDSLVIGHVGRFCQEKNHVFLFHVFKNIISKRPSSILLLVGCGELFEEMQNTAKDLGICEHVIFVGKPNCIHDLFSAMDVFVLPSTSEGVPLAAVEAQASGLPVLLSNCVSLETKVSPYTEFIPLNIEVWTNRLLNVVMHERSIGENYVKNSRFDISIQAEVLTSYYKDIISSL